MILHQETLDSKLRSVVERGIFELRTRLKTCRKPSFRYAHTKGGLNALVWVLRVADQQKRRGGSQ